MKIYQPRDYKGSKLISEEFLASKNYANKDDIESKADQAYVDGELIKKLDLATFEAYTNTEQIQFDELSAKINKKFEDYTDTITLNALLDGKADTTTVTNLETELEKKVGQDAIDTALEAYTTTEKLTEQLNLKADKADLANYVETTDFTELQDTVSGHTDSIAELIIQLEEKIDDTQLTEKLLPYTLKSDFEEHTKDKTTKLHITEQERANWNAKVDTDALNDAVSTGDEAVRSELGGRIDEVEQSIPTVDNTWTKGTSEKSANAQSGVAVKGAIDELHTAITTEIGVVDGKLSNYATTQQLEAQNTTLSVSIKEAKDAANAAQITADSANSAAEAAQETANNAQEAASTAQDAANEAQSTADAAQTSATAANTAASKAQLTADGARTAADKAQTDATKANTDLTTHKGDMTIHVTSTKTKEWDAKVDDNKLTSAIDEAKSTITSEYQVAINNAVGSVFKWKGTKATFDLVKEISDPSVGDVWNVTADGANYVYSGEDTTGNNKGWDKLSENLEGFATTANLNAHANNNTLHFTGTEKNTWNQKITTAASNISDLQSTTETLTTNVSNLTDDVEELTSNLGTITQQVLGNNESIELLQQADEDFIIQLASKVDTTKFDTELEKKADKTELTNYALQATVIALDSKVTSLTTTVEGKADTTILTKHTNDNNIHFNNQAEKNEWSINISTLQNTTSGLRTDLDDHSGNNDIHFQDNEKETWNTAITTNTAGLTALQKTVEGHDTSITALQAEDIKINKVLEDKANNSDLKDHIDNKNAHFTDTEKADLQQKVDETATNLTTVTDQVTSALSKIEELQAKDTALEKSIGTNTTDITSLKTRVQGNSDNISNIQEQLSRVEGRLFGLDETWDEAESPESTNAQSGAAVKGAVDAGIKVHKAEEGLHVTSELQTAWNKNITDLESLKTEVGKCALKSDLGNYTTTEAFNGLQSTVTGQGETLSGLQDTVATKIDDTALKKALEAYTTTTDLNEKLDDKVGQTEFGLLSDKVEQCETIESASGKYVTKKEVTDLTTQVNAKASQDALNALDERVDDCVTNDGLATKLADYTDTKGLTALLDGKANQTEINRLEGLIDGKVTQDDIDTALEAYTTTEDLTTKLNLKADKTDLANYAEKTTVTALDKTVQGHTTEITDIKTQLNDKVSDATLTEQLQAYTLKSTFDNHTQNLDEDALHVTDAEKKVWDAKVDSEQLDSVVKAGDQAVKDELSEQITAVQNSIPKVDQEWIPETSEESANAQSGASVKGALDALHKEITTEIGAVDSKLSGYVTTEALEQQNTTLTASIKKAQDAADAAKSAAQAAQTAAEEAQSTADTAQASADAAQETASGAQEAAATAQDAAEAAQADATAANTAADKAQTTAESASTAATNAQNAIDTHAGKTDIHVTSTQKTNWDAKIDKNGLDTAINKAKEDIQKEYQKAIDTAVSSVFTWKGSVDDLTDLTSKTDAKVGDVYNVKNENGANYVYSGDTDGENKGWDKLSENLEGFAAKSELSAHTGNSNYHFTDIEKSTWQSDISKAKIDIASAKSDISTLQGRVTTVEGTTGTLRTDLDKVTEQVQSHGSSIELLQQADEDFETELVNKVDSTKFTTELNKKANTSDLTKYALQTTVTALDSRVTTLNTTVTELSDTVDSKADASALADYAKKATVDTLQIAVTGHTTEIQKLQTGLNDKLNSSEIEGLLEPYTLTTTFEGHTGDTDVHLSTEDRERWETLVDKELLSSTVTAAVDAAKTELSGKITTVEGKIPTVDNKWTTGTSNKSTNPQSGVAVQGALDALHTTITAEIVTVSGQLGNYVTTEALEEQKATLMASIKQAQDTADAANVVAGKAQSTADSATSAAVTAQSAATKAQTDLSTHEKNSTIHITAGQTANWDAKIDQAKLTEDIDAAKSDITEKYTKAINEAVGTVFKWKGTTESLETLKALEEPKVGDVYNVTGEGGANYVYSGEDGVTENNGWDKLSENLEGLTTNTQFNAHTGDTNAHFTSGQKSQMQNDISKAKTDISALQGQVTTLEETTRTLTTDLDNLTTQVEGHDTSIKAVVGQASSNAAAIELLQEADESFTAQLADKVDSTKLTTELAKKADKTALDDYAKNETVTILQETVNSHTTQLETLEESLNDKVDDARVTEMLVPYALQSALTSHEGDDVAHVTEADRSKWNDKVDQELLSSTVTAAVDTAKDELGKQITALQTKDTEIDEALKGKANTSDLDTKADAEEFETLQGIVTTLSGTVSGLQTTVGNKADTTTLATHTDNSDVHFTDKEKADWKTKVDKVTTLESSLSTVSGLVTDYGGKIEKLQEADEGFTASLGTAQLDITNLKSAVEELQSKPDPIVDSVFGPTSANAQSGQAIQKELSTKYALKTEVTAKADSSALESLKTTVEGKLDTKTFESTIQSYATTVALEEVSEAVDAKAETSALQALQKEVEDNDTAITSLSETIESDYLTIADAQSTYLKITDANATYLKITDAADEYATKTELAGLQSQVTTNTTNITKKLDITTFDTTIKGYVKQETYDELQKTVAVLQERLTTLEGSAVTSEMVKKLAVYASPESAPPIESRDEDTLYLVADNNV